MEGNLTPHLVQTARHCKAIGSLVAALLTLAMTSVAAGQPTTQDVERELDAAFSWASSDAPGCAVAVKRGDLVVERAYGAADLERNVTLSPDSVFDVGSVVKQFVAAAVLLLVDAGELSLSSDIREFIPELPDPGHEVTVDHLLTHTGGVRDWTAIGMLALAEEGALTMALRQRGLNFAPGDEWSYSNSGYVLLKELAARVSGMTFSELAQKRLLTPLAMGATRYVDDLHADIEKRALAYEKQRGSWRLDMLQGNERGGGGALLSTASDLIVWNEALSTGKLGKFVTEKLQEPARLNNGRTLGYARGLFLDTNRGGQVIWHSGSAAGYKTLLSRYPELQLSIALLCNSGDGTDRSAVIRRLVDLFLPAEVQEVTADRAAEGISVDTSGRAGLFFSADGQRQLRLMARNGQLQVAGGPRLVARAADRFHNPSGSMRFQSDDEFELRFVSADELEYTSMEGQVTRYRRARPFTPSAEDMKAYAGRYESDEMGSAFSVEAARSASAVRLEIDARRSLELRPVARDTFQRGMMTVRFRRAEDGRVIALEYSNPLLRNVEFVRIGDSGSG